MRFFGHIVRKNGMEKRLMQGKMEGKRIRGRPATTWFQDLKEWTKLDIAGASQLATGPIGKDGEKSSKSQQRR